MSALPYRIKTGDNWHDMENCELRVIDGHPAQGGMEPDVMEALQAGVGNPPVIHGEDLEVTFQCAAPLTIDERYECLDPDGETFMIQILNDGYQAKVL